MVTGKLAGKGEVCDRPLKGYLGPDRLMIGLEHAADPELKTMDVMGMIKRIQVPGYDQATTYFDRAIMEGVIELNQLKGFYDPGCHRSLRPLIH